MVLAALASILFCGLASAQAQVQAKPLFSLQRASLAVGADYGAIGGISALIAAKKQAGVGIYAAYALVPKLTLAGSAWYGVADRAYTYRAGLRYVIWRGKD
jgi:hypothetical protein